MRVCVGVVRVGSVTGVLVEDLRRAVGAPGLDNLLFLLGTRFGVVVVFGVAVAHMHYNAGGRLRARVQLIILP